MHLLCSPKTNCMWYKPALHFACAVVPRRPALALQSCSHATLQLQSGIPVCKTPFPASARAARLQLALHWQRSACACAVARNRPRDLRFARKIRHESCTFGIIPGTSILLSIHYR